MIMANFSAWLKESEQTTRDRLEAAVREYMADHTPPERCYYITRPKNINFDPSNPSHIEYELGRDYDKSVKVVPFKHHPTAFRCAGVAEDLARFLREKGFRARKVAGWYGNAEPGYHTGISPSLDSASPPRDFGKNPQEHWWVEAEGRYIDLTSAQFHPLRPKDQKDVVIRDKHDAFVQGDYMPVRRFPLGRSVPLPPNASRMVDKILSLKKFAKGHSSNRSDRDNLAEWILRNAPRFTFSASRAADVVSALYAHTNPGFHFADRRAMERLFGEAFDDLEEDKSLEERPSEFKEPEPKASRGTIRFSPAFSSVTLSSTNGEDIASNFIRLKDVISRHFSDADFGKESSREEIGPYGTTTHHITARMKDAGRAVMSSELRRDIRREGFRERG
jgi:hypothetical protein